MNVLLLPMHGSILPFFVVSWLVELVDLLVQVLWQSVGEQINGLWGIKPVAHLSCKLFKVGHIRVDVSILHPYPSFELCLCPFFFECVGKSSHESVSYFHS